MGLPLERRAFDVVMANILAGPLVDLAPRLAEYTNAGGALALSGVLVGTQARALKAQRSLLLAQHLVSSNFAQHDDAAGGLHEFWRRAGALLRPRWRAGVSFDNRQQPAGMHISTVLNG